ncbi:hypothetical protein ACH5RR_032832 [Cinchona calisaya]|uniref:Uncharacterized protein n=1 Tax=Cinchona calisaya TaxID=153742 RepID=A0ABD2YMS3_9GENT
MPCLLLLKKVTADQERFLAVNMVVRAGGKNGVVLADTTTYMCLEMSPNVAPFSLHKMRSKSCRQMPHSPDNHAFGERLDDAKTDRVYIGSCAGEKNEDHFLSAA